MKGRTSPRWGFQHNAEFRGKVNRNHGLRHHHQRAGQQEHQSRHLRRRIPDPGGRKIPAGRRMGGARPSGPAVLLRVPLRILLIDQRGRVYADPFRRVHRQALVRLRREFRRSTAMSISRAPRQGDQVEIRKLPEADFIVREHELLGLPLWFSFDSSDGFLQPHRAGLSDPPIRAAGQFRARA